MFRTRKSVRIAWTLQRRLNAYLAYEEITATPTTLSLEASDQREASTGLVIHGLLGAGRNWKTISRSLAKQAADGSQRKWQLILADLRNHGASAAKQIFTPPHSISTAAQDLIDFYERTNKPWPTIVSGHSLGGKIVLEYLRLLREVPAAEKKLPKQVWVLDSQLGPVTSSLPANQQVDRILDMVQSVKLPIPSRKWLYAHVREKHGMSLQVAHWLGSNLEGHPQGPMQWMFNVQGAVEMYASYKTSSCWEIVTNPPKETQIHIVRADKSERWNTELIHELHSTIKATQDQTRVHVLENAGHWLHADNPEGLLKLVVPRLIEKR